MLDHIHVADGIAVPNFFNGRILSAEDLRMLLDGDRSHRRLLGRSIGRGVASGLRVSPAAATSVTVGGGIAVNGYGETVQLPTDVTLDLRGTPAGSGSVSVSAGVFLDCESAPTGSSGAANAFVLTIRPDSTVGGSAPADVAASGAPCGPGFVREGARFRRVAFDPVAVWDTYGPDLALPAAAGRRNALAHLFLGSWGWRVFGAHPFDRTPMLDGVLDEIGVDRCEVPLASFLLTGGGVQHLDMWGVRRRLHVPDPVDAGAGAVLEHLTSDVRRATGESTFHQFQTQLVELLDGTDVVRAADHFPYLPASGVLPAPVLGNTSNAVGFAGQAQVPFFSGLDHQALDLAISADRVEEILRRGTEMPAVIPQAGMGVPIYVALVEPGPEADRYAVFFAGAHPAVDLVRLDQLTDRLDELETRIDIDPATGPAVTVLYRPPKYPGATSGGTWSRWFLGPNPELAVGDSGMLRFEVVTSDAGEFQFDVSVDAERVSAKRLVQARMVGVEFEPLPDPHNRTLNAGTATVVVLVTALNQPFSSTWGGLLEGYRDPTRVAEVPVTLEVASTTDASLKDAETVIVRVTA